MCFVGGTKVITKDGVKRIEDVKTGDLVLASDPECGTVEYRRVLNTIEREAREVVDISVEGVIITCTPEHPFWAVGEGWTVAEKLKAGSRLLTKEGKVVCVESVKRREGSFKVYNFEVEQLHTYFVSSIGVLAHNNNEICKSGAREAAEALAKTTTPGGRTVTASHREKLLERFGDLGQVDEVIDNASRVTTQADGATVYIKRTGGRHRLYDMVVVGDQGIVTGMRGLTPHELRRLGSRYGFDPNP
jgi:hypothetical protein